MTADPGRRQTTLERMAFEIADWECRFAHPECDRQDVAERAAMKAFEQFRQMVLNLCSTFGVTNDDDFQMFIEEVRCLGQ